MYLYFGFESGYKFKLPVDHCYVMWTSELTMRSSHPAQKSSPQIVGVAICR